jgi:TAG lipase/steryl ester hydrolase/phospholipase A2/LPA acyltransferase
MTTLRDPASIHSQLHRKKSLQQVVDRKQDAPRWSRLGKRASFAAFSSVVRDTVSWAGDTVNTYRDGLSKEEREKKLRDDDRKQLLYLKMRNVSYPLSPGSETEY